ncbi:MAG: hypothetical protein AB1331_09950 [Bacillota bacterium]
MTRRVQEILLALLVVALVSHPTLAATPPWAQEGVLGLVDTGLAEEGICPDRPVTGDWMGRILASLGFLPALDSGPMTRAEVVAVLMQLWPLGAERRRPGSCAFGDAAGHPLEGHIVSAFEAGLVRGVVYNQAFQPDRPATLAEGAVLLWRFLSLARATTTERELISLITEDLSSWAQAFSNPDRATIARLLALRTGLARCNTLRQLPLLMAGRDAEARRSLVIDQVDVRIIEKSGFLAQTVLHYSGILQQGTAAHREAGSSIIFLVKLAPGWRIFRVVPTDS